MELLLAILLVYGITNIIVRGSIFDGVKDKLEDWVITSNSPFIKWPLHKLLTLISCPMCTGFWVGAGIGFLYGPYESWNIIFNGSIYSGIVWILHCLTQAMGQGETPEKSINIYNVVEEKDDTEEKDHRRVLHG